jgi:hypothetical protein
MSSFALCSLTESADQPYVPSLGSLKPRTKPKKKNKMATPDSVTTLDTSGIFVLNRSLSDDTDELLRLQGVSWMTRKAISYATITLTVNHYKDDESNEHIDIDQNLSPGGIKTKEKRLLTWREREHEDSVFGAVIGKSRRVTDVRGPDLDVEFLKTGWTEDTYRDGVIQSFAESNTPKSGKTWIVNQTWGFEVIDDLRRYARHLKFTGPGNEDLELKLVYDYQEKK